MRFTRTKLISDYLYPISFKPNMTSTSNRQEGKLKTQHNPNLKNDKKNMFLSYSLKIELIILRNQSLFSLPFFLLPFDPLLPQSLLILLLFSFIFINRILTQHRSELFSKLLNFFLLFFISSINFLRFLLPLLLHKLICFFLFDRNLRII